MESDYMRKIERRCCAFALAVGFCVFMSLRARAQGSSDAGQRTFASSADAVAALRRAVGTGDKAALRDIFGPDSKDMLTGDASQDSANLKRFDRALAEKAVPVAKSDDKIVLEIGANGWPYPIPLVRKDGLWFFDTASGKDEIIDRHVGKDELFAIGACRAYSEGGGPLKGVSSATTLHGYVFTPLSKDASPEFLLSAFPVKWGDSGIATFLVGRDGKVYKRNFREKTAEVAASMTRYDAGDQWELEPEPGLTAQEMSK